MFKNIYPIFITGINKSGQTILWQGLKKSYNLEGPNNSVQSINSAPNFLKHPTNSKFQNAQIMASIKYLSMYYKSEPKISLIDKIKTFFFFKKYKNKICIFKNGINYLKIRELNLIFPNSTFIIIKRKPLQNILSIIKFRKNKLIRKSPNKTIDNFKIEERVIENYFFGNKLIDLCTDNIINKYVINYEDYIRDPERILFDIGKKLNLNDFKLNLNMKTTAATNEHVSKFIYNENYEKIFSKEYIETIEEKIASYSNIL